MYGCRQEKESSARSHAALAGTGRPDGLPVAQARLLSRRHRFGGSVSSVRCSFGSAFSSNGCVGSGFADSGASFRVNGSFSSAFSSSSGIGSGFARSLSSNFSFSSGFFCLLRAGGQRQRQRNSSKDHLCVHVIYHPSDCVSANSMT